MRLLNLSYLTMYRQMLYFLGGLVVASVIGGWFQILPFNPTDIIFSSIYLVVVSSLFNLFFSRLLNINPNPESTFITALILTLIFGPVQFGSNFWLLTFASFFAISSKYLLVYRKKHLFNPAAFGSVAVAVLLGEGASWWVGVPQLLPLVAVGGFLIIKKIRRFGLVLVFLTTVVIIQSYLGIEISNLTFLSPLLFFAVVMLIEPATSPVRTINQYLYAFTVAILVILIPKGIPTIFYPVELSLILGNLVVKLFEPSFTNRLILKGKKRLADNIYLFIFEPEKKFNFLAGQYLEWTLPHAHADNRGIRRFFTIASSPTQENIHLITKFSDQTSSFKNALLQLPENGKITVSGPKGEFVLPDKKGQKIVLIAGGIGVTPYCSMVQYLLDKNKTMDITLLYSVKNKSEIICREVFEKAFNLGVKSIFIDSQKDGYIDEAKIKKEVPDYQTRMFYISGPEPMVEAFKKMLSDMGIPLSWVKTDYFPGYTEKYLQGSV